MARRVVAILALTLLASAPGRGQDSLHFGAFGDLDAVIVPVANIAGNDGWMPLDAAIVKYGIDPSFAETIMSGGGEVTCRIKSEGKTFITNRFVGWFLNGVTDKVHTVGHFIYDKKGKLLPDMPNCHFALNGQVAAGDGYFRYPLTSDPQFYVFGGTNPAGIDWRGDRAVVPLADGSPVDFAGTIVARPVATRAALAETVKAGDLVTLVSAARPFHKNSKGNLQPMAQRCNVLGVEGSIGDQPGAIVTDCDSFKGVSGSLAFARDPDTGQMVAIGMQIRARENLENDGTPIDGLPASIHYNAAVLLAIDSRYFQYAFSGRELAPEINGKLAE